MNSGALNNVLGRVQHSLEESLISILKSMADLGDKSDPEGTQAKYWRWKYKNAKVVKIVSYKELDIAERLESMFEDNVNLHECYKTALTASIIINGVDFVSGEASYSGVPIDHAWNFYKGKYFDLQQEFGLKGESPFKEYVKILQIDGKTAQKYLSKSNNKCSDFMFVHFAKENGIKLDRYYRHM
jgi:hypothetical protein